MNSALEKGSLWRAWSSRKAQIRSLFDGPLMLTEKAINMGVPRPIRVEREV